MSSHPLQPSPLFPQQRAVPRVSVAPSPPGGPVLNALVRGLSAVLRVLLISAGLSAFLVAALGFALHWQTAVIRSGSMRPGIPAGSIVLLKPVTLSAIGPGMVIGAQPADRPLVLHRVVSVTTLAAGSVRVVLKGDANQTADRPLTIDRAYHPVLTLPGALGMTAVWHNPAQQFALGLVAGGVLVFELARWLGSRGWNRSGGPAGPSGLRASDGPVAGGGVGVPVPVLAPDRSVAPASPIDPLAADRRALANLGVPDSWTRQMHGADRFEAVLAMLESVPDLALDADPARIAVIGPPGAVQREGYRIAVDLQDGVRPRPVLTVAEGAFRDRDLLQAGPASGAPAVIAIECADQSDAWSGTTATAAAVLIGAEVVIAVVQAGADHDATLRWVRALQRVDALAVDGHPGIGGLMGLLGLGLPVIRVDGVATDRLTLTSLLCGHLQALSNPEPVGAR